MSNMSARPKFGSRPQKTDNIDDWINQEFAKIGKQAPEKLPNQPVSTGTEGGGLSSIKKGFDVGYGSGNPIKNDLIGTRPKLLSKKDNKEDANLFAGGQESSEPIDPFKNKPLKPNMRTRKEDDNFARDLNSDIQKTFGGGAKIENPIRGGRKTPDDFGQYSEGKSTAMQNEPSTYEKTPKLKTGLMDPKSESKASPEEEARSSNIFKKPSIRVGSRELKDHGESKSEVFAKDQPKGIQPKETQQPEQAGRPEFNESFYKPKPFIATPSTAVDKKKEESEKIQKQILAEQKKKEQALAAELNASKKRVKGGDEEQHSAQKSDKQKGKKEEKDEYDDDFEKDDEKDAYDDDFDEEDDSATYKPMKTTLTQPIKPNFSKIEADSKKSAGKTVAPPIDNRSINFAEAEVVQVREKQTYVMNKAQEVYADPEKKMLQRERVEYLREVVMLEYEDFNDIFELLPTNDYELYVNRIKNGFLKNSADQSNDDLATKDVQTEGEFQQDTSNQCPEDRSKTVISGFANTSTSTQTTQTTLEEEKSEDGYKLVEFMQNAYPVFEELLALSLVEIKERQATKLDNIVLSFVKELESFFTVLGVLAAIESYDSTSLFVSYSVKTTFFKNNIPLSIIINYIGERPAYYFLSLSQVISLYNAKNFRNVLIGGSQDGSVSLWDMRDSEIRHRKDPHDLLQMLRENMPAQLIKEVVFRLPNFSTDYMTSEGHTSPITKITDYSTGSSTEILTLEEFGTLIFWNLVETSVNDINIGNLSLGMSVNSRVKVIKTMSIQLNEIAPSLSENNLLCRDLEYDRNSSNVFVCNVEGIVKADRIGMAKAPKVFGESSHIHNLPMSILISEYELFFVGFSSGAIEIYSKNFSSSLTTLQTGSKRPINGLQFPRVTLKNKKGEKKVLQLLYYIFAADDQGKVFVFNLDQKLDTPVETIDLCESNTLPNKPEGLLFSRLTATFDLELVYRLSKDQVVKVAFKVKKYITLEPAKIEKINQNLINTLKSFS